MRVASQPEGAPGVVSYDEQLVVLRDAFPKARSHTLLVARAPGLDSPGQLRASHGPLLAAMRTRADEVVAAERARDPSLRAVPFRVGFHAAPSLRPLHCHVISADLDSERMKNKKHW